MPDKVPELTKLVEAAIYRPISVAGAELASSALEATGNAALVQAALTSALTPEQAAMLDKMSDDPEVARVLTEVRDKLSSAVAESIETARKTVVPPTEQAVGYVVNGVIVSIMNAISDIPGVGILLSLLGFANTGMKALDKVTDVTELAKQAAAPVTEAMGEVGQLTGALNEAQKNAEASIKSTTALPDPKFVESPKDEKKGVNESPFATPQRTDAEENAQLGGGSRKRRRIHKLSRRIERTLRRVQKKYGLKYDKNDFLRRTLRRGA